MLAGNGARPGKFDHIGGVQIDLIVARVDAGEYARAELPCAVLRVGNGAPGLHELQVSKSHIGGPYDAAKRPGIEIRGEAIMPDGILRDNAFLTQDIQQLAERNDGILVREVNAIVCTLFANYMV